MAAIERVWAVPLSDGRVAEHVRIDGPDGKRVWWRIGDVNSLDGVASIDLPLYGADRLTGNVVTPIVLCEGEPATDALLDRQIEAVGTVTGATVTPCDQSLRCLIGRIVILWPDNDEPGRDHMSQVADRLIAIGVTDIRIVAWEDAPPKGDAANFSGDAEELQGLLQASIPIDALVDQHAEPMDLGALLDDVRGMITKYVALTAPQADAIALWVAHTHAFEAAETTPYLSATSPEKRSGKTRLLEVLELLVKQPWLTGRTTAAALARKVDKLRPTLLLDESDSAFKGDKEYTETLRGMLNTGHRQGGCVTTCIGQGANIDFKDFSTFCPKVIAGIGKLPDTVTDRSIPITMKRRARGEHVERFRYRNATAEGAPLYDRLARWVNQAIPDLCDARPEIPDSLNDRAADGWEPILAIADLAGDDWAGRARRAAAVLNVGDAQEDQSVGVSLLVDIRTVFCDGTDQLPSVVLIDRLVAIEESPWGEWFGKALTPTGLAKLLKPFGVRPRSIRTATGTPKGYRREDLTDAWDRYTPSVAATPQQLESERRTALSGPTREHLVADEKVAEISLFERNVADVADETPNHWGEGDAIQDVMEFELSP
jgi:hypothetical protein